MPARAATPLGDPKAGLSADLDALAAYVASLNAFSPSPLRNADGTLTAAAVAGKQVFLAKNCGSCHSGSAFTKSASNNPRGHRHHQRRQWQSPRRPADRASTSRRCAMSGRRRPTCTAVRPRRSPTRSARTRASRCRPRSSRTSSPTCRRSAARKAPRLLDAEHGYGPRRRSTSTTRRWHGQPGPRTHRDGQLQLGRLAGRRRQRGQLLGRAGPASSRPRQPATSSSRRAPMPACACGSTATL